MLKNEAPFKRQLSALSEKALFNLQKCISQKIEGCTYASVIVNLHIHHFQAKRYLHWKIEKPGSNLPQGSTVTVPVSTTVTNTTATPLSTSQPTNI